MKNRKAALLLLVSCLSVVTTVVTQGTAHAGTQVVHMASRSHNLYLVLKAAVAAAGVPWAFMRLAPYVDWLASLGPWGASMLVLAVVGISFWQAWRIVNYFRAHD